MQWQAGATDYILQELGTLDDAKVCTWKRCKGEAVTIVIYSGNDASETTNLYIARTGNNGWCKSKAVTIVIYSGNDATGATDLYIARTSPKNRWCKGLLMETMQGHCARKHTGPWRAVQEWFRQQWAQYLVNCIIVIFQFELHYLLVLLYRQ